MREKNFSRIKKTLGALFLMLFLFYYSGITFFPHAHTHNHSTFVHSHPYKKDCNGNANHTHTKAEVLLIAGLSNLLITASVFIVVLAVLATLFCRNLSTDIINSELLGAFKKLFNLRSPPFLRLRTI